MTRLQDRYMLNAMSIVMPRKTALPDVGSAAPWFKAATLDGSGDYTFHTVAGRPILMLFMGMASHPPSRAALDRILSENPVFDDVRCSFFGITVDPDDALSGAIAQRIPGIRYILDYNHAVSKAYGACPKGGVPYQPFILILDRQLRVSGTFRLNQVDEALASLKASIAEAQPTDWAPVLLLPRIFEPELCQTLIALYKRQGGDESGFMREIDGKTVGIIDHKHKRRSDYQIGDAALRRRIVARIDQRLRPGVQRAFQFNATRMERYIVACYDAEIGGHFRPHRDNTTKGTAHRRFAVTINLNSEDYEGGDLRFPEFGDRTYRAPTGGAVVFSCGLLHEATPVTNGKRYAFLPFLYDDAAAQVRAENNVFLGDGVNSYSGA